MALIAEDRIEDEAVARAVRAQVEYNNFMFLAYPDHILCALMDEEKEYIIKDGACSCPDYAWRCAAANIRCKHLCALEMAQAAGEVN